MEIGHINEKQFQKLCQIEKTIPRPTCFIYLQLHVEGLLTRIKERGRLAEKDISAHYLRQVQEKQELFIATRKEPVLILDAREPTNILVNETLTFIDNMNALQ